MSVDLLSSNSYTHTQNNRFKIEKNIYELNNYISVADNCRLLPVALATDRMHVTS